MSDTSENREREMPRHIAFIMDGNGRWAQARGLAREEGHKRGAATFKKILQYCARIELKCATFYAFSTENWKRPIKEVNAIMRLLGEYLDTCEEEIDRNDLEIHFIGDVTALPVPLQIKINRVEKRSAGHSHILNIALNYGSRDEILHAFRVLNERGVTNPTEADLSGALYTAHCPDPDLIVRTAGEMRLSNYLLWQAAYAEFYFTDTLWPDFSEADVDAAIDSYRRRTRRFGAVVPAKTDSERKNEL